MAPSELLPFCLIIIMFAMGLGLGVKDFKRVIEMPKAITIGLAGQLILLPLIAMTCAFIYDLSPTMSAGLLLLSLCPGGITSNLVAKLAKADEALSVSLTVISSLIGVFSVPLLFNFLVTSFGVESAEFVLPLLDTINRIFTLTLLPVGAGMVAAHYVGTYRENLERWFIRFGTFTLIIVVLFIWHDQYDMIVNSFAKVGPAAVTLNIASMLAGAGLGILLGLNSRQTKTMCLEVGLQNSTLAFFIAYSLLDSPELAIAAACYSPVMFITALAIPTFQRFRKRASAIA
ncbi:MAG: BASS family bile acid:Na+ symporter [Pseudomonadales bacterium]|jgi:BASS family bile acid:Na+ symporter